MQDTLTKMSSGKIFITARPANLKIDFNAGSFNLAEHNKKHNTASEWTELRINEFYCLRRESIFSRYIDVGCIKKPSENATLKSINGKNVELKREGYAHCVDTLNFEFVKVYLEFDDPVVNCVEYSNLDVVKKSFCVAMERFGECLFSEITFEGVTTPASPFYIKFLDEQGRLVPVQSFWLYNTQDAMPKFPQTPDEEDE